VLLAVRGKSAEVEGGEREKCVRVLVITSH
jgi:hypothetical protein